MTPIDKKLRKSGRRPPDERGRTRLPVIGWVAASSLLFSGAALAQEGGGACSLSSFTLTFGTINPQFAGTVYTSGNATVTCTGLAANTTVTACLSIGAGSASGSTATSRVLSTSGNSTRLPVAIKSTPAAVQQIGNGTSYPKEGPITFAGNGSGQASTTFPITVSLTGPLSAAPATYSNIFSSTNFRATYHTPSTASCTTATTNASGGQMTVQATVVAGCTVTATPLNFGSTASLASARASTSSIQLSCTQGVNAVVGLDNGQSGTGPTFRLMKAGALSINYGIYRDAAHALAWGDTSGVNTVSVAVSASPTTVTAYGTVPAQTTPAAGTYNDIVNVVVTY